MISSQFLTAETPQGPMDIYVASPESPKPLPVVIVFMEAFGVNSHIQSVCERLASEGFLAAAPDLYHRMGRKIKIDYADRKEIMPLLGQLKNEDIIHDTVDTIEFLKVLPTADSMNISTMGFCVGGFSSLLCAIKLPLKKMISFYGGGVVHERPGIGLHPLINDFPSIHCPCLFFFGGSDASIPQQDIKMIERKLEENDIEYEIEIFPTSDHGFFCDERKTYNQDDAAAAWKKSLEFLRKD